MKNRRGSRRRSVINWIPPPLATLRISRLCRASLDPGRSMVAGVGEPGPRGPPGGRCLVGSPCQGRWQLPCRPPSFASPILLPLDVALGGRAPSPDPVLPPPPTQPAAPVIHPHASTPVGSSTGHGLDPISPMMDLCPLRASPSPSAKI